MINDTFPSSSPESAQRPGHAPLPVNPFLPIILLGASLVVVLGWLAASANTQRTALEATIAQREPSVHQAAQIQARLKQVAVDVLQLAKTDNDAKAVVAKYKIAMTGQPAQEPVEAADPQ